MAGENTRIIQIAGAGGGGGPYTVTPNTPSQGDYTVIDTASGQSFVIPAPLIAGGVTTPDADTLINLSENTAGNGGDQMFFQVDGITVGSVEILAGGITKWTLDGILDPIVYSGTPITTAQRDALTAANGWMIFNSDEGCYQYNNGGVWYNISTVRVVNTVTAGDIGTAAPTGVFFGVDPLTGQNFYVDASGDWQAVPVASVDLNVTISDETGGNGSGNTVPSSAPAGTPDVGDIHVEVYDDVTIYFIAAAADWVAPTTLEFANFLTAAEIKTQYESNADTNAFTDAEQTKLAAIEAGATGDQTGAEIKVLYEGEADTNVFTDAEKTKLGGVEAGATADQTGAEIKAAYEAEADTNAFTDADQTKLAGIEAGATGDQTGAEIKSLYEGESDTNAFTDAEKTKLASIEAGADVTDAANVDAAGATMNTDNDVSGNNWVVDEDDLVSDSDTQVPTQQSVKSYVDGQIALIPDEVVENAGVLSGAVPAGAQIGIDTTTGAVYYNNGGTWAAVPVSTVDLNTTVSDETGANGTGNTSPSSVPAGTPDIGDLHIEIYDDVTIYFVATAGDWLTPAATEIARDITNFSDATTAADDATGDGGAASTAARSDHKHAAQGVSADANNIITVGADGLHALPLDPSGFAGNLETTDDDLQKVAAKFDVYDPAKDRVFADESTVSPTIAGEPTVADIATFAAGASLVDTVIFYTGTNTDTDPVAYVFHIDKSGAVTLIENNRGVSELYKTLVKSTQTNGVFPVEIHENSQIGVTLEDADGANAATYEILENIPNTVAQTIRLRLKKDIAAANYFSIGLSGGGDSSVLYVDLTNGSTANSNANVSAPSVLKTTVTDQTIELIVQFPFSANFDRWTIEPAGGFSAILGTADGTATGVATIYDIDFNDPTAASLVTALPIDSSAGPIANALVSATGSGSILFFVNEDVTNPATITPALGEAINGVTDGIFAFSNFAIGTQFTAIDQGVGKWSIQIVGASASAENPHARIELEWREAIAVGFTDPLTDISIAMQAAGTGTNDPEAAVVPFVKEKLNKGGMIVDTADPVKWVTNDGVQQSARTNSTSSITVPKSGYYRILFEMPNALDSSVENGDSPVPVICVNGLNTEIVIGDETAQETAWNGATILFLNAGDRVQLGVLEQDLDTVEAFTLGWSIQTTDLGLQGTESMTNGYLEVELIDRQEVVQAGMLTPSSLAHARFTLSADAAGVVCPFDEGQGDTTVITNAAGTITLPAGKYRIQASCTRQGAVLDYELYNVTDGIVLERFSVTNTGTAGSGNTAPYYIEVSVPTDIQIREGDGVSSITWNGRESGIDAGFDDVLPTYACYIDIQQVPTSTVVMPDALEVENLSKVGLFDNEVVAVFDGYEFRMSQATQEFEMRVTTGTKIITGYTSYGINTAHGTQIRNVTLDQTWIPVWIDSTLNNGVAGGFQRLYWNDGTNDYEFRGILGSGYNNNFIEIKRLNQKTVVMPDAIAVNDQASSGYFDIGNMRIQWGTTLIAGTFAGTTILLPADFGDSNYSIIGTTKENNGSGLSINFFNLTTNSVDCHTRRGANSESHDAATVSWQAIGVKP